MSNEVISDKQTESESGDRNREPASKSWTKRNVLILSLLFIANVICFLDRFTIAGVLLDVQNYFNLSDKDSGLMQTIFTCSYSLLAPFIGYLGDRYSRKFIMIGGIVLWSTNNLLGSFVQSNVCIPTCIFSVLKFTNAC